MSDKRRAEILAKRAKLEEMRKAKAQRQAEAERRTSLVRSPTLRPVTGWITDLFSREELHHRRRTTGISTSISARLLAHPAESTRVN